MTELSVRAAEDITFEGGMRLASKGDRGVALMGLKPNRPQHYGLVPVRWAGRNRAFWIDRSKLTSRHGLDRCITPPPAAEFDLTIPEGEHAGVSVGCNLRLFRRARGLSQAELAERMVAAGMKRISQTSISNWEHRQDCPSGVFLETVSRVLDVPAFAFFVNMSCLKVKDALAYVRDLQRLLCKPVPPEGG